MSLLTNVYAVIYTSPHNKTTKTKKQVSVIQNYFEALPSLSLSRLHSDLCQTIHIDT